MLLVGLGIGALASQLGAVTVSAVPDEQSAEVGGVQNTVTNLGASIGTALAGSVLIAALTSVVPRRHRERTRRSPTASSRPGQVELAGGIPFVSDADLETALDDAGVTAAATEAASTPTRTRGSTACARRSAILALLALAALFLSGRMPRAPPGSEPEPEPQPA